VGGGRAAGVRKKEMQAQVLGGKGGRKSDETEAWGLVRDTTGAGRGRGKGGGVCRRAAEAGEM